MAKGNPEPRKIGEGHLERMAIRGLHETGNIFSFEGSNIAQPSWYGLYGQSRGGFPGQEHLIDRDFDEEPSRESLAQEQGVDLEQDRDDRDERDMDLER